MYFFNKDNLKKFKSIMGNKVKGIIVSGKNTINIDEKEDIKIAEYYFKGSLS